MVPSHGHDSTGKSDACQQRKFLLMGQKIYSVSVGYHKCFIRDFKAVDRDEAIVMAQEAWSANSEDGWTELTDFEPELFQVEDEYDEEEPDHGPF